jgi:nicotinamide-nucleotide amidase
MQPSISRIPSASQNISVIGAGRSAKASIVSVATTIPIIPLKPARQPRIQANIPILPSIKAEFCFILILNSLIINRHQVNMEIRMDEIEKTIGDILIKKGMTLGVIESATGGLISHRITNVAGSSVYYKGSITVYSNEIKNRIVGVKSGTLEEYGSVSAQTAEELASGGKKILEVDVCIADTGIAGPGGGTPNKPVGLFYIGLSHKDTTFSRKHIFNGDRAQNKKEAAETALQILREYLESL